MSPECTAPWTGERGDFCYSVLGVDEVLTWHEARDECFQLSPGGDLTSIESEEERLHISYLVRIFKWKKFQILVHVRFASFFFTDQ